MIELPDLLARAATQPSIEDDDADPTRSRILDAALAQAASVGLERLTMEDVVRRSGLGRMTVYRRFARRDDLVEALGMRECRRFLAAVGAGLNSADTPEGRLPAGFVAAMRFARDHPMLRRLADDSPGAVADAVAADNGTLMRMGSEFIVAQIQTDLGVQPTQPIRRAADVLARLFLTYVALPPDDPDPRDDESLRTFADDVLAPIVERALTG